MPENQWDDLAVDGHGEMLNPDRLRHLYHDEQRPLRDIARRTLTTERVIRGELTAAGTTLQSSRPHRSLITREWFERHYLSTGKTVRQAARDVGNTPVVCIKDPAPGRP